MKKVMVWVVILAVVIGVMPVTAVFAQDKQYYIAAVKKVTLSGDEVFPVFESLMKATNDKGKYGLLNAKTGRVVLDYTYDYIWDFHDGLAAVFVGDSTTGVGKYGYINTKGEVMLATEYEWVENFREDLAVVYNYGKYGYIDKTGKVVIPFIFDEVWNFSEGLAVVSVSGKRNVIDKSGTVVIETDYDDMWRFDEGLAPVVKRNLGEYDRFGFIDKTGELVIGLDYVYVQGFSDSMAIVYKEEDYRCGVINKQNEIVIPFDYSWIGYYIENLKGWLAVDYATGLAGVIGLDNNVILPLEYDAISYAASEDGVSYFWIPKDGGRDIIAVSENEIILPAEFNPGRILKSSHDNDRVTIGDAMEVFKYLARMSSLVNEKNEREWNAALITLASQRANKPGVSDAMEILKYLARMDSVLGRIV